MAVDRPDPAASARAAFEGIGARALVTNRQRVTELQQSVGLATRGELSEDERARAADVAHQLVGSAGTFGYRRVSGLARQVELGLAAGGGQERAWFEQALDLLTVIEEELAKDPDELD